MRMPSQTTFVLLLALLPGVAGGATAQEVGQAPLPGQGARGRRLTTDQVGRAPAPEGPPKAEELYDWESYDWKNLAYEPKKKDPIKVQVAAAEADMDAAHALLAAGEKDQAVAKQQSALRHLLKARALKKEEEKKDAKPKKGKDKKEEKKPTPPPTLADALESFATGQELLAGQIAGRAAQDGERAEHHGLTSALDTLAAAVRQDWNLSRRIHEAFRTLQQHGHEADAAIGGGASDGADRARAQAAEARALAALIRTANDQDLAKQLDQMRQNLEDAANQLEKDPKGDKKDDKGEESKDKNAQGNDSKDGGKSKGDGDSKDKDAKDGKPESDAKKKAAEDARKDAARKVADVDKQLDAVKSGDREGLNAMKNALAQAKAAETLKRLAKEIPNSASKQEDAKHAKELRAAAKAMGKAAETLGRSDAEKIASALKKLEQAGSPAPGKPGGQSESKPGEKPGDTPGTAKGEGKPDPKKGPSSGGGDSGPEKKGKDEFLKEAVAALADAKDANMRGMAQFLARMQDQGREIPADKLAIIRQILLKKLRELRATELDHAKDAPIPGDSAPVSEAYLRALADDLDHPGE